MRPAEEEYPCVGICMADPDSGHCLGCGRPPLAVAGAPLSVAELAPAAAALSLPGDPDSPEYCAEHS